MSPLAALAALDGFSAPTPHDGGVGQVAALSGRVAYLTMCLSLCWGVLGAAGWVRRFTGHKPLRGGHIVLAAFALSTGAVHGMSFLYMENSDTLSVVQLVVPFFGGGLIRHAMGVLGFELLVAISITASLRYGAARRNWGRIHQLGYLGVGLLVVHAWLGAVASGHLAVVWLGGITALAPPIVLSVLRIVPPELLVRVGLVSGEDGERAGVPAVTVRISVDSRRCHRYGVCQAEAPQVFRLQGDGQLEYLRKPGVRQTQRVQAAARACPMRAIHLQEAGR
ncbi:4Fe-4S domain-containing protein [Amycolatopsis sp. NPDC059021]|uniref:4Fe-4S domain-containing protein n=1 Tax=Amycolatopsis sp. NPDC059021 TaxID=3346704 RepID=UPI00367039FC